MTKQLCKTYNLHMSKTSENQALDNAIFFPNLPKRQWNSITLTYHTREGVNMTYFWTLERSRHINQGCQIS